MAQEWWQQPVDEVLRQCGSRPEGLTSAEASGRRSNAAFVPVRRHAAWRLLLRQFTSPVMIVLIAATVVSLVVSDPMDGLIILVIIMASGLLGFFQERRADIAMVELLAGAVAHYLWGIDPTNPGPARRWLEREVERIREEEGRMSSTDVETRHVTVNEWEFREAAGRRGSACGAGMRSSGAGPSESTVLGSVR